MRREQWTSEETLAVRPSRVSSRRGSIVCLLSLGSVPAFLHLGNAPSLDGFGSEHCKDCNASANKNALLSCEIEELTATKRNTEQSKLRVLQVAQVVGSLIWAASGDGDAVWIGPSKGGVIRNLPGTTLP